ncbi:MAG: hypothetical protein OXI17_01020 [Gammaproteobacteria bacterium]|nr:hypothetical protein [Gammaproteobacteria bacterium]MDE0478596.1 hypothetical protein [Gammaproteobacteria bacterium]MDE0507198.1 hypothetical protein [Gammaproteobacteria bacterium]MXX06764.1 hypothetical protein [Gammaproteobacteria bacterium]MYA35591.1 hypothetical protein [Gammaproteobacteria bacterium]
MSNDGWKEWVPVAGVSFGAVAAAAALVLATTTITNSIVSGIRDDVRENSLQIEAMDLRIQQMQSDLADFRLETALSLQRIELQLQQVIHGDDLESPEGVAQSN